MTLTLTVIGTARSLPAQLAALRCRVCNGTGGDEHWKTFGNKEVCRWDRCNACGGTGVEA